MLDHIGVYYVPNSINASKKKSKNFSFFDATAGLWTLMIFVVGVFIRVYGTNIKSRKVPILNLSKAVD